MRQIPYQTIKDGFFRGHPQPINENSRLTEWRCRYFQDNRIELIPKWVLLLRTDKIGKNNLEIFMWEIFAY